MAGFGRDELEARLRGPMPEGIDASKEHEVHTDRDTVKLVGCRECQRPMVVTVFFAPAKAICNSCSPRDAEGRSRQNGQVGVPQPGRTDPAKATSLADCLVNPAFARALCPVHPDDESHTMELKQVSHSEHYGPGHWDAKGRWYQTAPGETALHQCTACNATVSYSTTQVVQFRRQNEPREKPDQGAPHRNSMLGVRGPDPTVGRAA